MNSIFDKVNLHKKQNLPFVLYRKPNSKTVIGVFQKNDHLYYSDTLNEKGFVFAPFEGNPIIFPSEACEVKFASPHFVTENDEFCSEKSSLSHDKEKFEALVQKGIEAINKGLFSKVVLSRTEEISLHDFNIKIVFERMLQQYSTAFCYCWFHPKIGMWMGATPEKLLHSKEHNISTVALAGTQDFQGNDVVFWPNKEREEQEFVTHFILDNLKNETTEINVSSPYTTRAGNLLHLKTDIEGVLNSNSNLKKVIDVLHPTPAVCGLPKIVAKDFIIEFEGYDREFYTGFLGEINHDFNKEEMASDLYVNLRCMKIDIEQIPAMQKAYLFIGCGITKSSNPESEWEETINKSKTMKTIL